MRIIRKKGNYLLGTLLSLLFTPSIAQVIDSSRMQGPEIKTFYSSILKEKRMISIQTPAGMNNYDAYPVLYVLDGETQTVMLAGQVQYLSEAYKIIPNLIVVGIHNTNRVRDLTPSHSIIGPDGKPDTSANAFGKNSGGGEQFLQFIKKELMPYIETRYKTAPFKILAGHSLGGLMAIHCLVYHPDFFNAYLAISPSLQWDNGKLLSEIDAGFNNLGLNKILFVSDANEGTSFHTNLLHLDSLLQKKNIAGLRFKRLFYPEESHISGPVKAFYDAIRFVYPSWHLPYNSSAFRKSMTSAIIKSHYTSLAKIYGYTPVPPHDEINQIGIFLRNDTSRIKDAIELLKMNAINYPTSPVVQETLGDTWVKAGNKINALEAFKKALQMNPASEKVSQKIKNLEQ